MDLGLVHCVIQYFFQERGFFIEKENKKIRYGSKVFKEGGDMKTEKLNDRMKSISRLKII